VWRDASAPGARFHGCVCAGAVFARADLSRADFGDAQARDADFTRATLRAGNLDGLAAERAVFEFCDLGQVVARHAKLAHANLTGANLEAATLAASDLRDAELFWAEIGTLSLSGCDTEGARWPVPVRVAYGPPGIAEPDVARRPLYRAPATPEEVERLLAGVPERNVADR
jgi:uncharacterized protein YjbI with pentapeptide repeats